MKPIVRSRSTVCLTVDATPAARLDFIGSSSSKAALRPPGSVARKRGARSWRRRRPALLPGAGNAFAGCDFGEYPLIWHSNADFDLICVILWGRAWPERVRRRQKQGGTARRGGSRSAAPDAARRRPIRPVRRGDLDPIVAIDATVTGLEKRAYWKSVYQRYGATAGAGPPVPRRRDGRAASSASSSARSATGNSARRRAAGCSASTSCRAPVRPASARAS